MYETPNTFDEVVTEIVAVTGLAPAAVEGRVWREALAKGFNVAEAAAMCGVTPHVYDSRMADFYKQTDSFLFETLVESCRPGKQRVFGRILERIQTFLQKLDERPARVLMLGDGSGSDTIKLDRSLASAIDLHYFDVPGSKTFEYARRRFEIHGTRTKVLTEYEHIPKESFDILICLELLEHLPDPLAAIAHMASCLRTGGISFVTESFPAVSPNFPTHLHSNLKYANWTPALFLREKLLLTYYNRARRSRFRPMEFTKKAQISWKERLAVHHARYNEQAYWKTLVKLALKRSW